ncbi:MAG: indole-3-glycerol phosphate synthase TrpC [Clostridiales bacterium]|nr:indole-3-glycerol phosphate synthase TrpC [Clostridiales bacterium]
MILDDICARKALTLSESKYIFNVRNLYEKMNTDKTASFKAALQKEGLSIIGEVKKASPSRGVIKADFKPVEVAKAYGKSVDAVSVLTEEHFFQGSPEYLKAIHKEIDLPLLRKDFVISPMQIFEARELGASAVLLIAAVLKDVRVIKEYIEFAKGVGLDALVETHNEEELEQALSAGAEIVGINNRNLKDFSEDIYTTVRLCEKVPKDKVVVSESSIHTAEDIAIVASAGVSAVLVGESFMRSGDIIKKAGEFREAYEKALN